MGRTNTREVRLRVTDRHTDKPNYSNPRCPCPPRVNSVFTRSMFQLPPFSELEMPLSSLNNICISELDVFCVLRSLDVTKAKGYDGISPKLLKYCALALYQPLHHLFSLSLSQKYLPLEWSTHLIHIPISLLSVVAKVLKKIIYNIIVVTLYLSPSLDFYVDVPPSYLFSLNRWYLPRLQKGL